MTFLLHNADGGLNCEAKLCVSLVQSRSCYYITDKSDTSFICPNTVQDITVSPCSITSQSSLRLSVASSILFVELCSIHAVKASLQNMRALIYVSDLLPQCRSSSAAVSLCWTDFLWCYSKVSILYQKSQSSHHASDFQLWAENVHIIARNPPIWSCRSGISCHRIPLKNVKTALNLHPPKLRAKDDSLWRRCG